jgi:hypothetical protein
MCMPFINNLDLCAVRLQLNIAKISNEMETFQQIHDAQDMRDGQEDHWKGCRG